MKNIDTFVEEYGEDLCQRLFECHYNNCNDPDICITVRHMINTLNYEGEAVITLPDGQELTVLWRDGNWCGSEIIDYGIEDVQDKKYYKTVYKLVPRKILSEQMQKVYEEWQKMEWFKKLESDINYDFYFSPTDKIKNHYREIANKKGMKIEATTIEINPYS